MKAVLHANTENLMIGIKMKLDFSNLNESIKATFRSKCAACGEWIEEGDMIIKDTDGNWIHEDCNED